MPRFLASPLAILGGLACVVLAGCQAKPSPAASPIPSPARIGYDNQCFIIDGKDTFLYSGSFHYFRCPKALWADRFQKMKDAGLNCVETYVAWNWHEQQPPASLDDFSRIDMSDLTDWLDMAINRFGFYVILRPGPYICAEWDGGGYPQWLATKKPAGAPDNWLRGDDPVYLDWCKHWYLAAAKAAVPFQITRRPAGQSGVILWQIENEYNYAGFSAEVKLHQLQALAHDSRDAGIDVPLITCMSNDPLFRTDPFLVQNVIECRNSYPKFDPDSELRDITVLETYQPEKPRMITELQGGWFSEVGDQLSDQMGYTPEHLTHVTLLAWAHGFTGTNYYMMFGGTNLGDWAAMGKTTTYDYAAPIREWGGVGARYFAVQAMANFLKEHGAQLARSSEMVSTMTVDSANVSTVLRRGKDGSRFLFIFNDQQNDRASGNLHVTLKESGGGEGDVHYDLDPFDARILYLPPGQSEPSKGRWFPEPVAPPRRPTHLPADVTIAEARRQVDPGPAADSWRDLPDGASVEDAGIFDRRDVFYRSSPFSTTQARTMLTAQLAWRDSFIAQLNDARLDTQKYGKATVAAIWPAQSSDNNRLLILYENGGRNNGSGIDDRCGLRNLGVSTRIVLPQTLTNWKLRQEEGDPAADIAADLDDSSWPAVKFDGRPDQVGPETSAVLRADFDLTPLDLKASHVLDFGWFEGERTVYVNGQELPKQAGSRFEVSSFLRPGRNAVAAFVKAGIRPAGFANGVELETGKAPDALALHWQISGDTAGGLGKWQDPALDDSKWETVKLNPPPAAGPESLATVPVNLVWYRLRFELPSPEAHVWVPWKLHLEATGNGFIYVNGHALGRWWEIGPQKDFYLPECWLNFGPGSTNVVTLSLRPTTGPASVGEASVSPYRDFAETR
ncbi:MAG: beta-galactosidase [Tepidisphaeraceae bacterium]